jgi:hypothetical protein
MRKSASITAVAALVAAALLVSLYLSNSESERDRSSAISPSDALLQASDAGRSSAQSAGSRVSETPLDSQEGQVSPDSQQSAVATPISIPREFEMVSPNNRYWHRDTWRQLHSKLEREPFDPNWSRAAEIEMMQAINSNQEIVRRGTPVVVCRTTICEMQLVVYGNVTDENKWNEYFNPVLKKLSANFKYEDFSTAQEGSVLTIVFILSRKSELNR